MVDQFAIFVLGVIVGGFVYVMIDMILKFREEDKRFKEWLTKEDENDDEQA